MPGGRRSSILGRCRRSHLGPVAASRELGIAGRGVPRRWRFGSYAVWLGQPSAGQGPGAQQPPPAATGCTHAIVSICAFNRGIPAIACFWPGFPAILAIVSIRTVYGLDEVGRLIRSARRQKGWTQAELAERANLSLAAIQKVERPAARTVNFDTALRLLRTLSLDLAVTTRPGSPIDLGEPDSLLGDEE